MDLWLDRERGLRLNPAGVEALARDIFGCPAIDDVHEYVEGSDEVIGAEGLRRVEEHIKQCPLCREDAERYRERLAFARTEEGRRQREEALQRLRKRQQE